MSRDDLARLNDIHRALERIDAHLSHGELSNETVYDAVRMRLVEIGEAVARLSTDVTDRTADVPWRDIAAMRNHLVHQYFDTGFGIIRNTVVRELEPLRRAIGQLQRDLATE